MDAPGCHSETAVTTLSTEKRIKSKSTPLKKQKLSAKDLVHETIHVFSSNLSTDCVLLYCITVLCFFTELLTIQSAEENDFVINYSPEVWKEVVNVWLGMYYDTNGRYFVNNMEIKCFLFNFNIFISNFIGRKLNVEPKLCFPLIVLTLCYSLRSSTSPLSHD